MKGSFLLNLSERWFRLLLRLYPADFRDEMGDSVVETYRDRARDAVNRGGVIRLAGLWLLALVDFLRTGPANGHVPRCRGGAPVTGAATSSSPPAVWCAHPRWPLPWSEPSPWASVLLRSSTRWSRRS